MYRTRQHFPSFMGVYIPPCSNVESSVNICISNVTTVCTTEVLAVPNANVTAFMASLRSICRRNEESPFPASPRRIPAVGLCPPRSPRRLGTPVGRVTVLDSLLAFVVFSRMRGQVPLPSRKPPSGGIHPYTTEGAPGLYVRRTGSPAARGPFRGISNTDSITPPHTEA